MTTAEAAKRLAEHGSNTVAEPSRPSIAFRVGRQLLDPLIMLLLAGAVVTTVLRDVTDTLVILLVVVVNTAIGVAQQVRADRAVAELNRLAAPTARVIRDSAHRVVPAAELVCGDRVLLDAGDVVPADVLLDTAERLQVDESALSGESLPVARDRGEDVSAGTVVVAGRGGGTVVRTGASSALGRIASLVATARPEATPLQRRLASFGRLLGVAVVALSALVLVLGLLQGRPLVNMVITSVSLVVAAVPESLPAVVTLALALGAARMSRHHAIVRRLHGVETLGSVTVIASDKTGTVTQNRMAVDRAVTRSGVEFAISGPGYAPAGELSRDDGPVDVPPEDLVELARAGLLCNDAALAPPDDPDRPEWTAVGDPLEAALVAFAGRCGLDVDAERHAYPRLAEHPFDAQRRRMSTVHRTPGRDYLAVCKGAPEAVLSADVLADPQPVIAAAKDAAHHLASEGLRVLAVAAARRVLPDTSIEQGLRLLGLVAIGDPLRAEAAGVADSFAKAGIRLVLVTGDHPATAVSIADRLGIWSDGDTVVRGDDGPVDGHADHARVYARTRPEQKLDIVRALQHAGHVVAMTGDGVNDAPALRRADIGVAMGRSGTEVARQAGDLILVDDNLATMAAAVEEGRRVYGNIRRFLRYGLAGGFAEILVMLAGPFLGLAIPLLPAQILWVNLLTHGLPGVALGAEPADPDTMRRPPRPPQESVLGAGLWRSILYAGTVLATTVLTVGVWAYLAGHPWQSMLFVVLGLGQLAIALAVRARRRRETGPSTSSTRPGHNPWLLAAVAVSGTLQVAAVYLPPLRTLLGTVPLSPTDLAICAAAAVLPGLAVRTERWVSTRRAGMH